MELSTISGKLMLNRARALSLSFSLFQYFIDYDLEQRSITVGARDSRRTSQSTSRQNYVGRRDGERRGRKFARAREIDRRVKIAKSTREDDYSRLPVHAFFLPPLSSPSPSAEDSAHATARLGPRCVFSLPVCGCAVRAPKRGSLGASYLG